jgi:predicted ferric reductase
MSRLRTLSLPILLLLFVGVPVFWAFPEALPFWRAVGIILGWAGAGLLLFNLLLMVREVRLANSLGGLERITAWHHQTGMAAYLLLLLHPLALAAAGWAESPELAWQVISPFSENWPVWLGWGGLIFLMFGLATTFMNRLAYGVWRRLHSLLGVGVLVGFVHVLQLGISAGGLLALAAAILILLWRLLRVDLGAAAKPYIVTSVRSLAQSMVEVSLKPLAVPIDAVPGQFVLTAFFNGPSYQGCGEFHPFTISGIGLQNELRIGVKALGDCTRRMQRLEPGVSARVHGPFGEFLRDLPSRPLLWVAGGIGITPFIGCLRQQSVETPTTLIYLYRGEQDAAYLDELAALAMHSPKLVLQTEATGTGLPNLSRLLPEAGALTNHECYVCGPPGLIDTVSRALLDRGVPFQRIHFEHFDFR